MPHTESSHQFFVSKPLYIRPWKDPLIESHGYDPRSPYVEKFWLPILGPSAIWLLRYLVNQFDMRKDGFYLSYEDAARSIGVSVNKGKNSSFQRTIDRICAFGFAQQIAYSTVSKESELLVRDCVPPISQRQQERLPHVLQKEHTYWDKSQKITIHSEQEIQKARVLALTLLKIKETPEDTRRQLGAWNFSHAIVNEALTWATGRLHHPSTQKEDISPMPRKNVELAQKVSDIQKKFGII